jgi:hypothetical protein
MISQHCSVITAQRTSCHVMHVISGKQPIVPSILLNSANNEASHTHEPSKELSSVSPIVSVTGMLRPVLVVLLLIVAAFCHDKCADLIASRNAEELKRCKDNAACKLRIFKTNFDFAVINEDCKGWMRIPPVQRACYLKTHYEYGDDGQKCHTGSDPTACHRTAREKMIKEWERCGFRKEGGSLEPRCAKPRKLRERLLQINHVKG